MPETLVEMIQRGESRARGYNDYNRFGPPEGDTRPFRGADRRLDFSQMTLGEIRDAQALPWNHADKLNAVGRYQIIGRTLQGAMDDMGLGRDERLTPELQDRILGEYLMREKRPAIYDYVTGRPGATLREAQVAMGNEWASVGHPDYNGRSRYDHNNASITLAQSEEALRGAREQYQAAIQAGRSADEAWRMATGLGAAPTRSQTPRAAVDPMADGVLQRGERGAQVIALQRSLNELDYRDDRGNRLETRSGIYGDRTAAAVRGFQQNNGLEATGIADQATLAKIQEQARLLPEQRTNARLGTSPTEVEGQGQQRTGGGSGTWPAPGNYALNRADKEGEGRAGWHSRTGGAHRGVDIQGNEGDPIRAFMGGVATAHVQRDRHGNVSGAGHYIQIRHDDGSVSKYFHLQPGSLNPPVGGQPVRVEEGQVIGRMGRTGNVPAAGDTHLHFELWRGGRDVDPMPALNEARRRGQDQAAPTPVSSVSQPSESRALADGVLKIGDRGPEVTALQERLNTLGYRGQNGQPLETRSGVYGPQTEHAVREFQRAHGLEVDGKAGQRETLPAVERAGREPLVSEATHPNNGLFVDVNRRVTEQAGQAPRREAIANIVMQMLENGFRNERDIQGLAVRGSDVHVQGPVQGSRVSVDLNAPTADMQSMSDHMSTQTREREQHERQRANQQAPAVMTT